MNSVRLWKAAINQAASWEQRLRGHALRVVRGPTLRCASGLLVGRSVRVEIYGELRLGGGVTLGDGCQLTVAPGASLEVGDDVFIGMHSVVVATTRIVVGSRVLIAEHCSIRDADHALDAEARAAETRQQSTPVCLEDDVWVGAGARILRGSSVGRGCVVAANAVVRGGFPPHQLLAGVPARIVRAIR